MLKRQHRVIKRGAAPDPQAIAAIRNMAIWLSLDGEAKLATRQRLLVDANGRWPFCPLAQ
jgi:hypothetical protein